MPPFQEPKTNKRVFKVSRKFFLAVELNYIYTAARLAQLGERRSAEREVVSSNPGRTNTQGLKIAEEKVLSL